MKTKNSSQSGNTDGQSDDLENKDNQNEDIEDQDDQVGQDDSSGDDDFDPKISPKDFAKKLRELSAEAKKYRTKVKALESEKERQEKTKLKEQGKYKEMYESESKKHGELKTFLSSSARSIAFKKEAIKQGADPELLDVLEKSAALESIELDESFKPNAKQVAFEVESLKKKHAKLFTKEVRTIKDGNPKGEGEKQTGMMAEIKAAKTQAQLDAVYAKYGLL